ncbi:molecular chaperone DnaJ [uncultured Helicobacter sp.]|uniref:molecular chaperone DnaJ n=1 Tax=uncultured Helicobacter sp. TaxID=175537 RepID=UPI0026158A59|nr:molecular chaperone DnaJ [uncultured Helicobacter sp.]
MEEFDYYEILEIERTSDKEIIKKAYRKLALKYHPDRNPDDKSAEERFKQINEAYEILSDDEKRQIYDRYGKDGLERQGKGFSGDFSGFGSIFEDLFGQAFGFGGGRKGARSQEKYELDFLMRLDLSFKEAVFGCKKSVSIIYKTPCKECDGSGSADKSSATCPDCRGKGQVFVQQGFMAFGQTCPRCHGSGSIITKPCQACKGDGFTTASEEVEISVPAGVDNEMRLRISGKGNQGKSGSRGDLYLVLYVQDDAHFIRNGNDIYIEVPVFFTQILLGAKIHIPSLSGEPIELNLPPNTKDKEQFVFNGEGVADVNTKAKGRLIAQVSITYPKTLSSEQKELLQRLDESFGVHSKPYENIFQEAFEKIKGWFSEKKPEKKKK